MSFEHEIERDGQTVSLEVEITDRGYPAYTSGLPEDCDPGEPPSWEVVDAALYDPETDDAKQVAVPDLTDDETAAIDEAAQTYVEEWPA